MARMASLLFCLAQLTVAARGEGEEPEDVVDPLSFVPFSRYELLRFDWRPQSPVTKRSFTVAPAAPLLSTDEARVNIVGSYRYDFLESTLLADNDWHRFEVGVPFSVALTGGFAWELDARLSYGGDLREYTFRGWNPNLRAGFTWALTPDFAISSSAIYTRGALGLVPVPVLGLFWRPEGRFRFEGLLPRYFEVGFELVPRVELFGAFHWESSAWGTSGDDYLVRQEVRTMGGVRADLVGPLGLSVAAQWTPYQQLETTRARAPSSLDDIGLSVALVLNRDLAMPNAEDEAR